MSAASAAVAAHMRRQREVVAAFVGVGAVDVGHAHTLGELGIGGHRHARALRQLRGHAVVRQVDEDRFWLHVETWETLRRRRHLILFLVVIVAVVLLILSALVPTAVGL